MEGAVYVAAIGKAAWVMAYAAKEFLGEQLKEGVIVTKYGHSQGNIDGFQIIEAGHPVPDENSVLGAEKILEIFGKIPKSATVLFLISGGGSALVELSMPGIGLQDIQNVTEQLLKCGASISEINVLRKKLSAIKGGKLPRVPEGTETVFYYFV